MGIIHHIYKTKNLATHGVYLIVFVSVLMVAGRFLIPAFKLSEKIPQLSTFSGLAFKYNDIGDVSLFIQSIKSNNGYLCLGTSESGSLPDGNIWNFLNNDDEIEHRFSILAGAGRTCGIYIPLFLHHRKVVDSLKIIYFINPVYWRTDLSKVDLAYWNRYSNYRMCRKVNLSADEKEGYYTPVQAYFDKLTVFQKIIYSLEYEIRKCRRSYSHDLKYFIKPSGYVKTLDFFAKEKIPLSSFANFGEIDLEKADTIWNILYSFKNKGWYRPIDETTNYRYEELSSFISLCRDLGINATFILGPYNGRFITQYKKPSLAGYQQTTDRIRQILLDEKVKFIDASDISFTAGAFNDHQHHSSYGAYLIYLKIKAEYDEKNLD